jgi:hypothetical protein
MQNPDKMEDQPPSCDSETLWIAQKKRDEIKALNIYSPNNCLNLLLIQVLFLPAHHQLIPVRHIEFS